MNAIHRTLRRLALPLLAVAVASPLHGAVLAYEGFAYPPGATLPGLAGGVGWSAPWVGSAQMLATAPTLQHPLDLPSTGVRMNNTAVGEAFRHFGGGGINNLGADLWFSVLERKTLAGSDQFVQLDPLGAGGPDIILDNDAGGAITMRIGGGPAIFGGLSAGVGQTDFLMLHATQFAGFTTLELFVNSLADPVVAGPLPTPVNFQQFYWRTDAGIDLDEIRAGTTEDDVAAVPGPGAGMVLAVGLLGVRRRR